MATKRTYKQKYEKAVELMNWLINYGAQQQEKGYANDMEWGLSRGSQLACKFILEKLKQYEEEE